MRAFTLIELLIVAVIIGIIAKIAIPSLLRSRMAANAASAAFTLRTLLGAQTDFSLFEPGRTYATTLMELYDHGLIDAQLASGAKSGYLFTMSEVTAGRRGKIGPVAGPAER